MLGFIIAARIGFEELVLCPFRAMPRYSVLMLDFPYALSTCGYRSQKVLQITLVASIMWHFRHSGPLPFSILIRKVV